MNIMFSLLEFKVAVWAAFLVAGIVVYIRRIQTYVMTK